MDKGFASSSRWALPAVSLKASRLMSDPEVSGEKQWTAKTLNLRAPVEWMADRAYSVETVLEKLRCMRLAQRCSQV